MNQTMLKVRRERVDAEKKTKSKTWALLPLSDDCPYLFAALDPESKFLRVESKYSKAKISRFYQYDKEGRIRIDKNNHPLKPYEEIDYDWAFFILDNPEDIENFVKATCINADDEFEVSIESFADAIPPGPDDVTDPNAEVLTRSND